MRKYLIAVLMKTALFLIILHGFSQKAVSASRYGDLLIQAASTAGGTSCFGYVDYRVTISNTGAAAHTVELVIPKETYGYGNYVRQITRKVTVPPGSISSVSLFQPPLPAHGNWAGVAIDGKAQRESLPLDISDHCQSNYNNSNERYCILLSRQVGYDDVNQGLEEIFGVETKSYSYGNDKTYSLALSELPVSDWSQNWLSYSRYNGILLTEYEWKSMPVGVRSTILEYIRCGGSLLVIGDTDVGGDVFSFGQANEGFFKVQYLGFGMFLTTDHKEINNWTLLDWEILKKSWAGTSRNLQITKKVKEANDWFPVIDDLSIPIRGLLLIVLIFAILIGPVNLFILSRKKRQICLLWTVPLLSFIASVIVFGYATLAEGWKGYTRVQSLTILDENENLASTFGIAAFYCPLTPRDGLHFDYETECTPQVERHGYSNRQGRHIDWTEDQHLKSGWIASRVPAHFKLRKSQMRREKIVFSTVQSQDCEALNGFGVPVETLYYADADGVLYHAVNVQPGAKVKMQRIEKPALSLAQNPSFVRNFFERDWHSAVDEIIEEPVQYLKPNCYIAIVKEPLFVEQALAKQKSEIFESVIYGISQENADAG